MAKSSGEGYHLNQINGGGHSQGGSVGTSLGRGVSQHAASSASGSGRPKSDSPVGGAWKQSDQDQADHNDELRSNAVGRRESDRQIAAGENLDTTHTHMNMNSAQYDLAQQGNKTAAGRVQDTDAVIASARGDAPGTEYTDNGTGDIAPIGSNMAPLTKPK